MKKAVFLALLLSCILSVMACSSHKEGELAYNATHHWYTCENKGCDERINETPHTWDDGETVKEPTETQSGSKIFICTVCRATKTEKIPQTVPQAVTKEGWDRAFSSDNFLNVTATLREKINTPDGELVTEYKIMADGYLVYLTTVKLQNGTEVSYSARLQDSNLQWLLTSRDEKIEDVTPITVSPSEMMTGENILKNYCLDFTSEFDSFTFDQKEKCYKADKLTTEQGEFTHITVEISEGRIVSVSAKISHISEISVTLEGYGTTKPLKQDEQG